MAVQVAATAEASPEQQPSATPALPPVAPETATDTKAVLAAYKKLYKGAMQYVSTGSVLVAACCTSRVERPVFYDTVRQTLGRWFNVDNDIPPEVDHPVGFPQADYLKILAFDVGTY